MRGSPVAYTEYEKNCIRQAYKENAGLRDGWLSRLAEQLNRPKTNISRYARKKGWTDRNRTWNEDNPGELSVRNLTCEVCGNNFEVFANDNKRKTCSDTCLTEHKKRFMEEWHATHEHPRGMQGKTQSAEMRKKTARRVRGYWENITEEELEALYQKRYKSMIENGTLMNRGGYSRARGGKRKDLDNIYFRSRWEANYARYLSFLDVEWEYEPETYIFEEIKRGTRSYTPDYYIPDEDVIIEVKGYLDSKSRVKLKRMKKYYPDKFDKMRFVVQKLGCSAQKKILDIMDEEDLSRFEYYDEIDEKMGGLVPHWE